MHLFYGVLLMLLVSGCTTVGTQGNVGQTEAAVAADPFVKVVVGMTHKEVTDLLDGKVTVGYEVDPATGAVRSIEAGRLYASEILNIAGQSYQVDRYIAHDTRDGAINVEADLFPLAYKDGILVAKGVLAVEALKAQ
jgi:hypothetical protein